MALYSIQMKKLREIDNLEWFKTNFRTSAIELIDMNHITEESDLDGLPEDEKEAAKLLAEKQKKAGL